MSPPDPESDKNRLSRSLFVPKSQKYLIWYGRIVERARHRKLGGYSEWHHVVPRSLGGGDNSSNLVQLTYREHFLVHWLLTKMPLSGKGRRSMALAFRAMALPISGRRVIADWQFEVARRRRWISPNHVGAVYGRTIREQARHCLISLMRSFKDENLVFVRGASLMEKRQNYWKMVVTLAEILRHVIAQESKA